MGGGFIVGSVNVLYEDHMSQYFGHFLKTYLGEGIVREHKCLIIDPEPLRSTEHWHKFLPQVSLIKAKPDGPEKKEEESK